MNWIEENQGWGVVIILLIIFGHETIADILTGAFDGVMVLVGWL